MWVQSLGWEDSPRGGHGHPLPYSCLENPTDRGASGLWSIRSQRVQHNWNNSMHTCTHTRILVRKKRKKVKSFSRVWLFANPWTVPYQASLSMGFSRQGSWSGLLVPSPGDLPDPGNEPRFPALQADALPSEPPGRPQDIGYGTSINWTL